MRRLTAVLLLLSLGGCAVAVARAEPKAPEIGDKLSAVQGYCSRLGGYYKINNEGDGVYNVTCDTGPYLYTAGGGTLSDMRIRGVARVWKMSAAKIRAERQAMRKAKWIRGPTKCSLSKDCETYAGSNGRVHSQWRTAIFDGTKEGSIIREDLMEVGAP